MRNFKVGTVALLVALTLVAGCSGDGGDGGGDSGGGGGGDTARQVETTARMGEVVGRLGKPQRRRVLRQVTAVVDGWLDAAYVAGDYPRSDFADAFPGFTKDAAALARKQPRHLSNAAVGRKVEAVEVTRRTVTVDVLAPGRRAAGATARVVLVIDLTGDVDRRDRIRGRLLLTPTKKGWQVFGFDVRRDQVKGGKK